jgi:uncharacterized membrane protein
MVNNLVKKVNTNRDKQRMQYRDWRTISLFGYIFGGLLLVLGIYVYVYYETNWIGWIGLSFYPYRIYAIPTIIVGFALVFTGYITNHRPKTKTQGLGKQQQTSNLGVCSNCGTNRDVDAQYCKKCGKKFE